MLARSKRRRFHYGVVEQVRTNLAPDFDYVAEPFRSNQAGQCTAPLDDQVGCDRRAMTNVPDVLGRDLVCLQQL